MKAVLMLCMVLMFGCASTEEFVEGSKILGSALWASAGQQRTTCVTSAAGHNCYTYNVPDQGLSVADEQAIEIQVTRDMLRSGELSQEAVLEMYREGSIQSGTIVALVESGDIVDQQTAPPDKVTRL